MAIGGRQQQKRAPTLAVCLALSYLAITHADISVGISGTQPHAETQPATEFSRHAQLKPRIYHGREKRQIATTREVTGEHVDHIIVDYDLDDENYILDLRLNQELIPKDYFVRMQQDGRHVINRPSREDVELCHYHGKVRDRPNSWAALSSCNDTLRGVVFDGAEMHYVEHFDGEQRAYKHADYSPTENRTCGYGSGAHHDHKHEHSALNNEHVNRILRYKRSTPETLVRGPYNANKQSRYVELVLVVDNRQFKELDENLKVVEQHCKDIANTINALYSPLNIYIALVGVVIWTDFDEIVFSSNGDVTLTNFLHYRREKLIKEHPNDNAQLLTKFTFENGVVGKALKGPICTYEYSGGVNTEHSNVLGLVATTVAHEMGHNFGMEHDTNECSCADERCIMAPSSSTIPPTHWSSCSLDYLALAFEHGMDYCLRNKPTRLFDSPVCGNGFVEPGEQCDCGLPEHCDNTCCNATACMLYSNASCATGECCDLSTCMPKNAGTMCRSADYECDLPEYCTGQSEYCPDDIYKMDTESCDSGKAYCYHGFCRTRSDQCKLLWGNTGKSSDEQCYKMNTKGTRHGNCGYNKLNQSYFRCNDENVLCGMLHCKHLNERLEFGMESVAILSQSFINLRGAIIACRTAIVDLGLNQVDPGLAPDGASCGEGKMCVNQKCMAVDSLRSTIGACPNNCNGNGVCNSMGHCHCKNGFAPPDCDYPGPGGSSDSGPAEDPNSHRGFVNAMFIFFLGIVPATAMVSFVVYYLKHNVGGGGVSWKKSPATQMSPPKTRSPSFSPESPKKSAEDNHSLLPADNQAHRDEFFGQFKGYSLTPIKKALDKPEDKPLGVVRPAPQVPKIAQVKPNVKRTGTNLLSNGSLVNQVVESTSAVEPPALPPLNPGSHPRPIISSPTLQNSTCTAKELISPLRNVPKNVAVVNEAIPHRVAPDPPTKIEDSAHVSPHVTFAISPVKQQSPLLKDKKTTLNRIASFLKPEKKAPKVPKPFIEKDLRSVDISGPIPQSQRHSPEKPVARTQSMKATEPLTKPKLQSFGSMRDPSKRPLSMVGTRPKSPPPPTPIVPLNTPAPKQCELPTKKQVQSQYQNQYDDCLTAPLARSESTSPSSDNIYAVIEDTPMSPASPKSPQSLQSPQSPPSKNTSNSTSNESFGLLGEIVSEIQNRNFDSIYSTSTLARKKKEKEKAKADSGKQNDKEDGPLYENTSKINDETESVGTAEGEYSNMNRGYENSASSTSSGYIHPSAVNRPKYENPIVATRLAPVTNSNEVKALSSFKKPTITTTSSVPVREAPKPPTAPVTAAVTPATPTKSTKVTTTPSQVTKQTTPTNLRTRKASPARPKSTVSATPVINASPPLSKPQTSVKPNVATTHSIVKPATSMKPVISASKGSKTSSNSPDLVNCSTPPKSVTQKAAPDVLNNGSAVKKTLQTKKSAGKIIAPIVSQSATTGSTTSAKGKIFPVKNSNVASLQQKFENKT